METDDITSAEEFTRWCTGLAPYAFEEVVAELIQQTGKDTEVTPRSGDGGVDVIVYEVSSGSSSYSSDVDTLVEVKQKSGKYSTVDATPLEKLVEIAPEYDPNRLMIVTTAKFGGPVTEKADKIDSYDVELVHTDELYEKGSEELISRFLNEYESHPGRKNWW
ncbi:hypothetical protein BRC95_10190 [Halobacteriales archaeon QS_5_68_33]|nr:MAG: hypothetical protein BRC95_10190 [Halobacteriales archaeon QS_5_68_33]